MANKRQTLREGRRRAPREIDESLKWGEEFTLIEVATRLKIHRVTLLRMEQRKFIPAARWRRSPPRRVYNETEVQIIKDIIQEHQAKLEAKRNYVEPKPVGYPEKELEV